MKKIQQAVVYSTSSHPQFVNAITQIVGLWAAQLVPLIGKSPNSSKALYERPSIVAAQLLEPFEDGDFAVVFSIELDLGERHDSHHNYSNIVIAIRRERVGTKALSITPKSSAPLRHAHLSGGSAGLGI